jgi:hypothetical protein
MKKNAKGLMSALVASSLVVSSFTAVLPAFADEAAVAPAASASVSVEVSIDVKADLKAFADIKAMFTAEPKLADIKAFYVSKLQPSVQKMDATIRKGNPVVDENIMFVLNQAVEGKLNAGQAKQAVDKGLQWYFYNLIRDLVNTKAKAALEKGDTVTAKAELSKAFEAYTGAIQPTAQKRDNTYKTHMKDLLDNTVFPALQADIENKDVASYNLHRQMLDKTIIKIYTLATLTYASAAPAKPVEGQAEAVLEGYFLFLPVYAYLKGGSPADADFVKDAFGSGDVTKVDAVKIKAALARTNIGKVSEYVKRANELLESGDKVTAPVLAMEGAMFLAALETFIGDALGAEAYAGVAAHGQSFLEAVIAGNKETAAKEGFEVLQFISKLDGVSLQIGTPSLNVANQAVLMDTAPYIHTESERTLVPARFIAEALGAAVDYVDATRTVIITKGEVKTELVLDSDVVVQNGKAVESLKLDQPAILKDERTFIPLRAVAELFGNKVFYYEGDIVIVK